ncbi:MAG: response regulator transcription factor [Clostridia bacterium]|nr:response regulator transcription factor [Clostridia bacterium]
MATILMYEPNEALAQKLCDFLKKENYDAIRCDEHDHALPGTGDENAPLVILDAQLKWTLCRPLLEQFSRRGCPILFVTGDRQMSAHLRALYAGASDVLVAPFGHKALKAKVQALLGEPAARCELALDEQERAVLLDGRRVELTAQEYALLNALMEKPDVPVSREQLLRTAWGYQSMGETRTVDVHVQRLRKKLGGDYIETVYKCGYRLRLA